MLASINGVVDLAAAAQMDLAEASDIVTDNLSAFGLEASNAGKMADQMAYAQANSNTTVEQLSDAFKNCAANMNASGQSMETTTALLEAFANQGIKGSEAGTKLSAIMRDITAKMEDGKIQIGDTAVAVTDANGNFRDLTDILADVETATDGMGTAEQAAALSTTFTSRSVGGLNMILNEGVDKIKGYKDELSECDGAAASMADTMQNNLQGSVTEFKSALEGLGIAIYNQVVEPLTNAVEFATGVISGLTNALTPAKTEMQTFADSIKQANDEVQLSLEAAENTVSNTEAKVAELDAYSDSFDEILDKCEGFNEVTLDDGEKAIKDSSGNIVEYFTDVGDKTDEVSESLSELGKDGIDTVSLRTSTNKASQLIGYVKDSVSDVGDEVKQTYVITDEFTKSKITTMVNTLGSSVDGLAESWNSETGELNASRTELEKWFSTAKEVAAYEGYKKAISEVSEAYGDAAANLVKTQSAVKAVYDEYNELNGTSISTLDEFTAHFNQFGVHAADVNERNQELKDSLLEFIEAEDVANDEMEKASEIYDNTVETLSPLIEGHEETAEATEQAAEATGQLVEADEELEDTTKELIESLRAQQTAQNEVGNITLDARDKIIDAFEQEKDAAKNTFGSDIWGGWSKDVEKGIDAFRESLQSQIDGLTEYQDNLGVIRSYIGETSPEFVKALEDMGDSGVYLVEQLAEAYRNGDTETAQELIDQYMQVLDQKDQLAEVMAQDAVAIQVGKGEMASSARDWTDLKDAFDECVEVVEAKGGEVSEATLTAFDQAVENAKINGVAIPQGLAEELRNSEDPETALNEAAEKLNAAIIGQQEGLNAVGIETGGAVTSGVSQGITDTTEDVTTAANSVVDAASSGLDGMEEAGTEAGNAAGAGAAAGITEKESDVTGAADSVVNAAKDSATTATEVFNIVGHTAVEALKMGFAEKSQEAASRFKAVLNIVKNNANNAINDASSGFKPIGDNAVSKFNSGVEGKKAAAGSTAKGVVDHAKSQMNSSINDAGSGFNAMGKDAMDKLAAGINTGESSVKTALDSIARDFDSLESSIQSSMSSAASNFNSAVSEITSQSSRFWSMAYDVQGAMNALQSALSNIHVPYIQVPHVRWNWNTITYGDGDWVEVPDFYVTWYAKAMDEGMILNNPTIFGMANGKFLGGGEVGSETVVGTESLMDMISRAVGNSNADVIGALNVIAGYMPQVLSGIESEKLYDPDGNYMGKLTTDISNRMSVNTRRARYV